MPGTIVPALKLSGAPNLPAVGLKSLVPETAAAFVSPSALKNTLPERPPCPCGCDKATQTLKQIEAKINLPSVTGGLPAVSLVASSGSPRLLMTVTSSGPETASQGVQKSIEIKAPSAAHEVCPCGCANAAETLTSLGVKLATPNTSMGLAAIPLVGQLGGATLGTVLSPPSSPSSTTTNTTPSAPGENMSTSRLQTLQPREMAQDGVSIRATPPGLEARNASVRSEISEREIKVRTETGEVAPLSRSNQAPPREVVPSVSASDYAREPVISPSSSTTREPSPRQSQSVTFLLEKIQAMANTVEPRNERPASVAPQFSAQGTLSSVASQNPTNIAPGRTIVASDRNMRPVVEKFGSSQPTSQEQRTLSRANESARTSVPDSAGGITTSRKVVSESPRVSPVVDRTIATDRSQPVTTDLKRPGALISPPLKNVLSTVVQRVGACREASVRPLIRNEPAKNASTSLVRSPRNSPAPPGQAGRREPPAGVTPKISLNRSESRVLVRRVKLVRVSSDRAVRERSRQPEARASATLKAALRRSVSTLVERGARLVRVVANRAVRAQMRRSKEIRIRASARKPERALRNTKIVAFRAKVSAPARSRNRLERRVLRHRGDSARGPEKSRRNGAAVRRPVSSLKPILMRRVKVRLQTARLRAGKRSALLTVQSKRKATIQPRKERSLSRRAITRKPLTQKRPVRRHADRRDTMLIGGINLRPSKPRVTSRLIFGPHSVTTTKRKKKRLSEGNEAENQAPISEADVSPSEVRDGDKSEVGTSADSEPIAQPFLSNDTSGPKNYLETVLFKDADDGEKSNLP